MANSNERRSTDLAKSGGFSAALDPFAHFRNEIDDLFGRYFRSPLVNDSNGAMLVAYDVAETEHAFEFKLDVPGIDRDDIDISFERGRLSISGERRQEDVKTEKSYRRAERTYGSFAMGFALPNDVDGDKIQAELKDGVLTVTVPKSDHARKSAKKISVS
ncbi:MAG: Hsp20/alpha crystallin family protein [Pseudomonadota bacterium]